MIAYMNTNSIMNGMGMVVAAAEGSGFSSG